MRCDECNLIDARVKFNKDYKLDLCPNCEDRYNQEDEAQNL